MSNPLSPKPMFPGTPLATLDNLRRRLQNYPGFVIGLGAVGLLMVGMPIAAGRLSTSAAESAETAEAKVLQVETFTAEPVDSYDVARIYTGEIAALRASDLGFEQGGRLVEVFVEDGDRIAAGAALAQLDTRNLQTQRLQLEAEKARANAQLAELQAGPRVEDIAAAAAAARNLEQQLALQQTQRSRREVLYERGAISKEELDEFAFGQGSLQAQLDQAQSNLEELRNGTRQEQIVAQQALVRQLEASIADLDVTIAKSTLRAPFDGIVSARQVDEGTVVGSGQSVVRLVENEAPEARIGMPTDTANQQQVGSVQTLTLGAETYSAAVTAILPEVDSNTRTQVVVFNLETAAIARVNPGQTVRVELTESIPVEGFWLPTESLVQGIRGLWNCYVVTQPEGELSDSFEVQPLAVEILHQEGDRVLVQGTVQPGDRIVANGTHRLVPGQRVEAL